jgi:hypothetical protein
MTNEQLDMIKRLQSLFKEKMWEWQFGDSLYDIRWGLGIIVTAEPHILSLKKTRVLVKFESLPTAISLTGWDLLDSLRIPKPIDPWNSERGLWGMLDWRKWYVENDCRNGNLHMKTEEFGFNSTDPFTALLKALCQQEGV